MSEWYIYMLRCADGSLYTGATTDLRRRVAEHNRGAGAAYTRSRLPVTLAYAEAQADQSAALRREAALKAMKKDRKEELIQAAATQEQRPPQPGTLYLVATPIGNLEDVTQRALRVLREVAVVAAEDTRQTRKLMTHFDIHTPLVSYHEHNEQSAGAALVRRLQSGEDVALVSDAGMPGISDPGAVVVQLAIREGIRVVPVPGPVAAISALVVSGLDTAVFAFEGFLPRAGKARREALRRLAAEPRTVVLYEAPHRLTATLADLAQALGPDRPATVARELTKLHEEVRRGTLAELQDWFSATAPRGECTLVLAGAPAQPGTPESQGASDAALAAAVAALEAAGTQRKAAMKQVAQAHGLPKERVYKAVVRQKDGPRPAARPPRSRADNE